MHVPQFEPKQGVQIETDPKATNVSSAAALGDDEGVIDSLIKRLEVRCFISRTWPITYPSPEPSCYFNAGRAVHTEEQLVETCCATIVEQSSKNLPWIG